MLLKRWVVTKGYDKGAKVEMWEDSKGNKTYIGRTRTGAPYNIKSELEAKTIIKNFRMEVV